MSAFTYYLPGQSHADVTPEIVRAVGLGDRLGDCLGRTWQEWIGRVPIIAQGPDGGAGAMLRPRRLDEVHVPMWSPKDWTGTISDNGQYWVCWQPGDLPSPESLKRRKLVDGVDVEMLDGRPWHCPTIRKALAFPGLPCAFTRANGEVRREVVPAYRDLWEASAQWAAEAFGSGLSDSKLVDVTTRCLGVNYRVGDEELRILGLLDSQSMADAVKAALDFQFFEDAQTDQKKSALLNSLLAAASGSPGSEDSTPDTAFQEAS